MKLDDVRAILPELDELRAVMDHVIATSLPDEARAWAGSGRLGTVGSRDLDASGLAERLARVAEREAKHLQTLFAALGRGLEAAAAGDGRAAGEAFLEAAALEEGRGDPERARAYAAAAHALAREGGAHAVAALARRRWARAARACGRLDEALEAYAASHEAEHALGGVRGAAEAAVGAGNVLEELGRWAEAGRWYERALDAVGELEGPVPERLHALFNLHVVTRSAGRLEEAATWLGRASAEAAAVDADGALPFFENARGQLAMSEGAFDRARDHFQRALDAAADPRARVTVGLNLAESLLAQGRGQDATERCRDAEREALAAALVAKLPEVYRLLGRIAAHEGEREVFVLFERALEIVRERGLPTLEEAVTLQAYAEAQRRLGDDEAADTLQEAARALFEALGIRHMRRTWADVYDSAARDHGDDT